MCDSPDAISPSGEPIEPMTVLQVLVVTNKVLCLKSQLIGKDRLWSPKLKAERRRELGKVSVVR